MGDQDHGLRERLAKQGEETLGKLTQDLLENPLVSGALTRAFEARERASQAQEVAMGALNLPSAADLEKLTRRVRSVAQRLEGIEDALDRLDRRLEGDAQPAAGGSDDRLAAIEDQLAKLAKDVGALTRALEATPAPVHRAQEALDVTAAAKEVKAATARRKPAARKPAAKKST